MVMPTGSFDIDPGLYGMGQLGQQWSFTVSPGIVLDGDTWGDDGQHIGKYIVQNADGSYTFTVPSDGSWLGGVITGAANAPACAPATNQRAQTTSSSSLAIELGSMLSPSASLSASATGSPGCPANYIPPLTPEQWEVQKVDDFFEMYFDNTSHWQELGLMRTFFQDFAGGEAGDGEVYVCTATNEADCAMLQGCSLIATGPENWLTPYKTQAYYIWAAMTNFSKLMNMIWQALEWAEQDMDYFAGEIGSKFEVELSGASLWSKVLPILNTILTLLAIVFIATESLPELVGALIGLSASVGLAADVDDFVSSSEQAEVTLQTIYTDLGFSQGWIETLQDNVNTMHNKIWYNGTYGNGTSKTNAKQLMTGGAYVTSAQVLAAVDLNSTNHENTKSGPTNAVTNWFENLLVANLINNWFKSNNAYIVYIPYGQVSGLNSDNSMESFTEDDCNSQWVGGTDRWSGAGWNSSVVVNCESGGMAVLTNGGSSIEKPSFYEVANMTYNGYTYSAHDMITSSVNGFLQYGFNYNATDSFVAKLLDPTAENLNNIEQYLNLVPTSAGMYNLPVCRLYDLGVVPNSVAGPFPDGQLPGWPSQTQPCTCMSEDANVTINGKTTYFRDFAGDPTTTEFNKLIKEDGNLNSTCYVTAKNTLDCFKFPQLCHQAGPGPPL
ncbi:hypothetical protein HO133_000043 [Letharia lupina]|uniref:Uncharacterized protein n=1 Tax=Letharia lupina TaxID=560253 RepID=A0A8H6CHC7_9LECA|nr:uncharacterized protein HO133_000043 [Letharia lupina]KAF6223201.1 hypothetical protein HO133_000043 [Letharia lupina]